MNLNELKGHLLTHADLPVAIHLPDGGRVPRHFHVTEVGHIAKKFVDCGGAFRESESCVLQTWIGKPEDDGHRLVAGKLARILGLAHRILPDRELPVEVEYDEGFISQFPLAAVNVEEGELVLHLASKHTACLAREKCGVDGCGEEAEADAACCGGGKASCC